MTEKQETQEVSAVDKSPTIAEKENVNKTLVKTDVQKRSCSFNLINLFDEKQLAAAENFLTKIMRSEKGGIKSINDGLAMLMRAQDLNLPFSSCLEHIHVINGKTGVDIHIIKALLLRAGCVWRCLKDYQPLYEYTDSINVYLDGSLPDYTVKCKSQKEADEKAKDGNDDKVYVYPVKWYQDLNGNIYKDYQLNGKQFGIGINRQQIAEIAKSGRIPVYRIPNKPIDYITEYELTRVINDKVVTAIGHFSYSEAIKAELLEKDNYKKYPRIMIGHRAFVLAARDIASDVLFGVMETTELKAIYDKPLGGNDFDDIIDAEVVEI